MKLLKCGVKMGVAQVVDDIWEQGTGWTFFGLQAALLALHHRAGH